MNLQIKNEFKKMYDLNIVSFPLTLAELNGKKQMFNLPITHGDINMNNCLSRFNKHFKEEHNGLAIITGERSGVIVIDIDDKNNKKNIKNGLMFWNQLIEKHGDINTWKAKSPNNGYHYYFLYNEKMERFMTKSNCVIGNVKYSIDIRNNYNGFIFAPPSQYKSINGDIKEYVWINSLYDTPIAEMPDWLFNMLNNNDNIIDKYHTKNERKKNIPKKKETIDFSKNQFSNNVSNDHEDNDPLKYPTEYVKRFLDNDDDIDTLKRILVKIIRNLDKKRNNDYDEWVQLGMLLVKFGYVGIDLWKEFSKQSNCYNEREINYKINTFSLIEGLTLIDLLKWLKDDNNKMYLLIYDKYKNIIMKFIDNSHHHILSIIKKGHLSIAEYYCKLNKGKIKYCNKNWYHFKVIYDTWEEISSEKMRSEVGKFLEATINACLIDAVFNNEADKILNVTKLLKQTTNPSYVEGILKYCSGFMEDNEFENKLDSCRHVINFKNGIYDFKNECFRRRIKEDYVNKILPYDYKETFDSKIYEQIRTIFMNISNDDSILYDFHLQWLGYCLTGETSLQKFLFVVGHTAANGKSTMAKIFSNSFPIYSKKLNKETFNKGYTKVHKQFAKIKKPVRFVYIEELDRKKLDIQSLKDFVDGDKIGNNEVMYGTAEDIDIHSKLLITSNSDPIFDNDAGIRRRGLLSVLTNKFVTQNEYENSKNKKGYYLRDGELVDKFITSDNHKIAFFHLLLPHVIYYYKHKSIKIPKFIEEGFEDLCKENDPMAQFIEEHYIVTDDDNDRIHKNDFLQLYNDHYGTNLRWNVVISDVKRLLTFKSKVRANKKQGAICGIKLKKDKADFNKNMFNNY